jgi:NADH-quinone oxidoreductase subunit N
MSFITPDLFPALPEIVLTGAICVVLVADLFVSDERRVITYWVAMVALLVTSLAVVASAPTQRVLTFSGSYVSDSLATLLKFAAIIGLALVYLYSRDYLRRSNLRRGEFYTLGLFGLLGIFVMVSSNSLLNTYLGLEILSLSLYSLVAFDRDSGVCAEAAMKYFVLGAIASGTLLYGISLIYGLTGTIQFDDLAVAVRDAGTDDVALWFGVAFLVVGIAFKFGGVPFHMWVPDVYEGARTPVTLYIGSLPKIASFALAARVLVEGLPLLQEQWQAMLMVVGVLSIALGNVVAIAQTNLKRMLAYSTISHVGFILLGFFAGTPRGYEAALFYTLTYMLMSAGTFGMIVLLSRQGFEAEEISDFKGLNSRSPWFAAIMACFMFGMAGIPPWVGFWAKLNVIASVIDAGRQAGSGELLYTLITLIMVVFSVIGAFYYLRVLKYCYFDQPDEVEPIDAAGDVRVALSLNGLAVLALGIVPGGLMALCAAVIA